MLEIAVSNLKDRLAYSNIAFSLLPREFTLTDLQHLYEIILGYSLDKRNFRKNVLQNNLLKPTGKHTKGTAHRPAKLYKFVSKKSQMVKIL